MDWTIEPVEVRPGVTVHVVRDDLIPGGTKQRVIPALFTGGGDEFVYASPAYGYAQIALAHTARAAGLSATIFTAARKERHPRTEEARLAGAKVVMVPTGYMSNVRAKARAYCEMTGAVLLPFGLDTLVFNDALAEAASDCAARFGGAPEVWSVAGSGVLARALQRAWPDAEAHAVRVGSEPDAGGARIWLAPERFEQDARGAVPPFPSCSNYDRKAWRFIVEHAQDGAIFWNVAA